MPFTDERVNMKIHKAVWKISTAALALIFVFAGAVPAKTACTGVCSCHAGSTAEHRVHQNHREISHGMSVRLLKEPQSLPNPLVVLDTHDPACHEETAPCHTELAQPMAVRHKTLIALIQVDHFFPDWVAVTAYPLFGDDTLSTGNVFREWTSADENPVPLYLKHLALIC